MFLVFFETAGFEPAKSYTQNRCDKPSYAMSRVLIIEQT
jgi:hypothetical protein